MLLVDSLMLSIERGSVEQFAGQCDDAKREDGRHVAARLKESSDGLQE